MKRRILYVNPYAGIGGAEVSLLTLLQKLDKSHYEPILLLPSDGPVADQAKTMGVQVIYHRLHPMMIERDIWPSIWNALYSTLEIPWIWRLLRDMRIDLVHINSYRMGGPVSIAASILGVPTIWHLRELPTSRLKRRIIALASMKFAAGIIAISRAVAVQMGVEDCAKTKVIYNAVDIGKFEVDVKRGKFRAELNISEDSFLLCAIGQLIPMKGYDFLIRTFATLSPALPSYLVIVGGNVNSAWSSQRTRAYVQRLHHMVRELGLTGRVFFTGFRHDIQQILADADLYIHAAVEPEPFGRVLVEAMAARKTVIAPRDGGIPEIVIDGVTGFLYPPRDVKQLRSKIEYVLGHKEILSTMGQAGYERARKLFSARRHADQIIETYEQLLR